MSDRPTDHQLDRLVFFSDAVFAIAITLLVIEIHVPVLPHGSPSIEYWAELSHLIPPFAGFVVSFLVIARFWMTHHAAFAHTPRFEQRLMWPNVHMLMAVAFMPFATAFLAQNFGEMVPALVYNLTLVVTALLSVRLVRVATAAARASARVSAAELAFMRTRGLAVLFASVLALLLGFVVPMYCLAALASTPLWLWLLRRRTSSAGS